MKIHFYNPCHRFFFNIYYFIFKVDLFLNYDKSLCYKAPVHKHSPLHLAARNGHADVVKSLLDHGMPVNARVY